VSDRQALFDEVLAGLRASTSSKRA